jgi:uncharacterized protein YkwD
MEEQFLVLINKLRTSLDLSLLKIDTELTKRAHKHNVYMNAVGDLSHDGFEQRMDDYWTGVENVAWNQKTAQHVFDTWCDSSGHYKNMIKPELYLMGLDYSHEYWTLLGCRKDYKAPTD